ncbi:hypothetical protein ACH4VX_33230 [Streptomyces sp. NPDC020731]|uniref:hypothetical protein n=1 Tax=Streptomyces sp. NPDC020731 TaxID=3365085 RepID=UPI0037A79700
MLAQPTTMAPVASLTDAPAFPSVLLDGDRAADPVIAAQRANTFVTVPGAVEVPSGIAKLAELMKSEADKYRAAVMRGDVRAAASGLAAVGILYQVASAELGAPLDVVEAALVDALRGAR